MKGSAPVDAADQRPRVTIGMPVRNGEHYISKALDSLLRQSFSDFELIISDNASTDRTQAICSLYAARDGRIRYIRQAQDIGALANFEFLLDQAMGDYFMWAAADDEWDPDWIERLLDVSSKHQCLAYGLLQSIDEGGRPFRHPANARPFEFSGLKLYRRGKYFLMPGALGKANPIYGLAPFSVLKRVRLSRIVATSGRDMLFLYSLLESIEIKSVPGVFLYKRDHPDAAGGSYFSHAGNTSLLEILKKGVRAVLCGAMLRSYLRMSSASEAAVLIILYPIAASWIFVHNLRWMLSSRTRTPGERMPE